MDDSGNTPFELQDEYGRTLLACRVGGTVSILLASVWCAWQHHGLQNGREMLENMVAGGISATPLLTRLAFDYESTLAPVAALCALVSLVLIWIGGKRISQVIYATVAGAAVPLLTGLFFAISWSSPFHQIITNFKG
ncbi:MAG TPA: hypothetical protein VG796_16955 [Verrucomicrobiales bacterium]|nr:hypothetical protein [Verrucomicrobiales bacterium]